VVTKLTDRVVEPVADVHRTADGENGEPQVSKIPLLVGLLLVISTVSWRPYTDYVFYSGGTDPIVVGKAMLSALGLALAWTARQRSPAPRPMGTGAVWLLLAYVVVSTFGAWTTGDLMASAVLGFRVLMHAATVMLLVKSFAPAHLVRAWLVAMMTIGLFGAATGLPSLLQGRRLGGGLPPLNPNEVALLCAVPAIGVAWLMLTDRGRGVHGAVMVGLLAVIWASGSRTALFALLVALFVMVLQSRRLRPGIACTLVFVFFGFVYAATATSVLTGYFARGGEENVTTLSSRTIAWSAAFSFPDTPWVRWMGAGLARKQIPVEGQYWDQQLLDSSWISALVQAGLLGALILLVWILFTGWATFRVPAPSRMLYVGLMVFLLVRSVLESGLLDSTPAFITFFLVSLLVDRRSGREDATAIRDRERRSTRRWESNPVPSSASGS
jgi:hypothetical protein